MSATTLEHSPIGPTLRSIMKRKPIRPKWDDLEAAFSDPDHEARYNLDLVTGHVMLETEGDDEDDDDVRASGGYRRNSPLAPLDRPSDEIKMEWLRGFVAESTDLTPAFVAEIGSALESDDPVPAIKEAMLKHPEDRNHWYLYRSTRIQQRIEEWLRGLEIETLDEPPWREG